MLVIHPDASSNISTKFLGDEKAPLSIRQTLKCFTDSAGETSERWDAVHMGFLKHVDMS